MKKKPNTEQFTLKKDPNDFLEGAVADKLEKKQSSESSNFLTKYQAVDARVHREQKVFRLSLDLINVLKKESYERSMETGSRVTETELVEQALREFFDITL